MKDMLKKISITFKDYYLTILLFAFSTVEMMSIIQSDNYGITIQDSSIKLVMTLIYGGIFSLIIKFIIDRLPKKKNINLLYLLVPIVMILTNIFFLKDISTGFTMVSYLILCILTISVLFIIPFINNKEDSSYYTYKVLINLALTMLCYFLLILGVFAILQSISALFEIKYNESLFAQIYIFILGFFMPTLFFTLIPDNPDEVKEYPKFINTIINYIVYPILSIYTIILYAYFVKILIEFKLPSNMLGNLTIFYSLISVVVLYFTHNIKHNKWGSIFHKYYPYDLIIPIFMMLIAVMVRIKEYGITEARYYGILCFIFVLASIFVLKEFKKVKYLPVVLSVLLFISIIGPVSASNISKISQEKRLEKILIKNNMLKDDTIIKNTNISKEDQEIILSVLYYFDNNHDLNDIKYLKEDFNISDTEEVFGFKE